MSILFFIGSVTLGVALGLFFRARVLIPTSLVGGTLVAVVSLRYGHGPWRVLLEIVTTFVLLQGGYVGGVLLHDFLRLLRHLGRVSDGASAREHTRHAWVARRR